MKTILAPVDFSEASTNALSFAAELSRRASARLIIVYILQGEENEEEARNKLTTLASGLKKSFNNELLYETVVERGNLVDTLEILIADQHPDLIVMGTKGATGLKRILIGSNTVNVIAKIKVPVFVIPEVARFKDFHLAGKNRIVLATDLDELENENALDTLKEIALLIIEPKVRVLSVRSKSTELSFSQRMEREALLSRFNPEVESERVTVFSSNVMSGINFYLNKNTDTGLIAMIARDSGQLIQKHYTHEMASHTQFPLLVLHDYKV